MLDSYGEGCIPFEGHVAGEHLKKDNAKFIDIGAVIDVLAAYHLGWHVFRGAEKHACGGEGWGHRYCAVIILDHTSDAKVCKDEPPIGVEQEIGRFEVSMDYSACMGVIESRGCLIDVGGTLL